LHIPDDAHAKMKVRKLFVAMRDATDGVGHFTFEFQMKISELQLKLQPTTPPRVQERRGATIKESIGQLDVVVHGCDQLLNQAMDIWDTLHEDPNLHQLRIEIREAQQKYGEISMIAPTLVPIQCFVFLQEGKAIQM